MNVWLHTTSPPQLIQTISEADFSARYGRATIDAFLAEVNERRGRRFEVAVLTEDFAGGVRIHVFDTVARCDSWLDRNRDEDVLLRTADPVPA